MISRYQFDRVSRHLWIYGSVSVRRLFLVAAIGLAPHAVHAQPNVADPVRTEPSSEAPSSHAEPTSPARSQDIGGGEAPSPSPSQETNAPADVYPGIIPTDGATTKEAVDSRPDEPRQKLELDQIIVTARRKEESLQDVPISISVLGDQELAEQGIRSAIDLGQASPGLSTMNFGTRAYTSYSIRGMGEAFAGSNPGVVAYFAEAAEFTPFFYDLSAVEVLKGPQGTLFGRNTTGGAVLLSPKKPTVDYSGYVVGRAGNHDRRDVEWGVGGPVFGETLTARLAGQILRRVGYTKNLENGVDLDDEHRSSFRGSLLFRPAEWLENHLVAQYDDIDENGTGTVLSGYVDAVTTPNRDQLGPYMDEQKARGPRKVRHEFAGGFIYEQWGVINSTSLSLGEHYLLKNIVRYSRGGTKKNVLDGDGSPYRNLAGGQYAYGDDFRRSVELQLQYEGHDRFSTVAGAYFENNHLGALNNEVGISLPGPVPVPARLIAPQEVWSKSLAPFVQGTYRVWSDLSLTAGFRRTYDERDAEIGASISVPDGVVDVPLAPIKRYGLETRANSWNITVDNRFTPDILGFVSLRRGYKAGGYTSASLDGDASRVSYKPEYVTSHEIGLKSEGLLGESEFRANVGVYYDEYTDIQRNVVPPLPEPPSNVVTNAAKATLAGADVDLLIVPAPYLEVALQYSYLKTAYQRFDDPAFGDLGDSLFTNAPEHQVTLRPSIHFALPGNWGEITAQTPFFYQSKFAISVNNTLNGDPQNDVAVAGSIKPGFSRVDFRLDWREIFGPNLSAGLYVRNLTNRIYEVGGNNIQGTSLVGTASTIYGAPRLFSLELRYDF